ncbi:MAG: acyl-CoA thioesterase [Candidatus Omnitrophica bacterium]|nr:acyl-CoA thioesterase [Candidatus Omnitrophota bacterium]
MKIRIYYHHTDCGGVVYYANYLKFLEEARTEFMEERGASIKELSDRGVLFVVARQEIDYKLPAFYADVLQIDTKIVNMSAVKAEFEYQIQNQKGQIVTKAKTILVCVGKDLKPKAIPQEIRNKLNSKGR